MSRHGNRHATGFWATSATALGVCICIVWKDWGRERESQFKPRTWRVVFYLHDWAAISLNTMYTWHSSISLFDSGISGKCGWFNLCENWTLSRKFDSQLGKVSTAGDITAAGLTLMNERHIKRKSTTPTLWIQTRADRRESNRRSD